MGKLGFLLLLTAFQSADALACAAWGPTCTGNSDMCCPSGQVISGTSYQCDTSYSGPSCLTGTTCGCQTAPSTSSSSSSSSSSTGYVCEGSSSSTTGSSSSSTTSSGGYDCQLDMQNHPAWVSGCTSGGGTWDSVSCCCTGGSWSGGLCY